ncbi:hypothetical protein [Qipengyuania seohaensis]|uniref:hypothetical protein n=1 Tax=Qipengyuania seohaensis TaxID=266951 RepID=UPI000C22B3B6|nr:hypothetical protein [Qipengyuania seohaensis]
MASIALHPRTEERKATESEKLYAAWRRAKGSWDLASYAPETFLNGLPNDEEDAHCDATCKALNAYLLHPTDCPRELARKLRVMRDEEIYDSWTMAPQIAVVVAADAHRVAFGSD